jgi:peptidoglycan/xylan/chitin deacetylase (PgdA/CDA1 family)
MRKSGPVEEQAGIRLSPYRGLAAAAVALSFDYETSAAYGDLANLKSKLRGAFFRNMGRIWQSRKDLSFCYGLGYGMRHGAENVLAVLARLGVPATWFASGHALLLGNRERKAFRINQTLPYATKEAGFTEIVTWRRDKPTFSFEPFSDHTRHPFWYFGDQSARIAAAGHDIQCHTVSHPYVALEPPENVALDLEDWQAIAVANGFRPATVLAFPFCGDAYRLYDRLQLRTQIGKTVEGEPYRILVCPDQTIRLLRGNGIQLLTRCGSRIGARPGPFSTYYDAPIHCMSDVLAVPLMQHPGLLGETVRDAIDAGAALDLWLHPLSVFSVEECSQFEAMVGFLVDFSKRGTIWLAPISEIWEHSRRVAACTVTVEAIAGNELRVAARNAGEATVSELGLEVSDRPIVVNADANVRAHERGLVIAQLGAGSTYSFRLRLESSPWTP